MRADTIIFRADDFAAAYDKAIRHKGTWQREQQEGKSAMESLLAAVNGWAVRLDDDDPSFKRWEYGDRPDLPDEIFGDAQRLMQVIDHFRHANGMTLPYREEALGILGQRHDAAKKEYREALLADGAYRKLLAHVREAAAAFDEELAQLRRDLAMVLGEAHADYQKLRPERAEIADPDD